MCYLRVTAVPVFPGFERFQKFSKALNFKGRNGLKIELIHGKIKEWNYEKTQYEQIAECFPKQKKPAKISNLGVLNAVLYEVENGCKWWGLPKEYGDWHVIYVRINRWAKKGVFEKAFLRLQQLGIIQVQVNVISVDSTYIKVHPGGMGALEKTEFNIWPPHLSEMG